MNELQKLDKLKTELALAETFEEIALLDSAAEAYATFAKRNGMAKEQQDEIGKYRIEVEAKKGEWLDANFPHGSPEGESGKLRGNQNEPRKMPATKKESAASRALNRMSKEAKDSIIEVLEEGEKVVTPQAVVNEFKKIERQEKYQDNIDSFNDVTPVSKDIQIIEGDSIKVLPTLKVESFDLLITDPPYGMEFQSNQREKKFDNIENDSIEDTISVIDGVLMAAVPLLKAGAQFYMFGSINYLQHIKPIIEKHLTIKQILIWDRGIIGMGDLKSYGTSYEIIYFGYKKDFNKLNGIRERDVLQFNKLPNSNINHPTEKPTELIEYLVRKSSNEGDSVLDPFAGSGSTLIAARDTNRKAVGIELEKDYVNLIKSRL